MFIEERLAIGTQIIRVITHEDITKLAEMLKTNQQGITIVDGHGAKGPVKLVFMIVKRVNKKYVLDVVHQCTPNAFYSIEDVKGFKHGVFTDSGKSTPIGRLFSASSQK